MRAVFIIITVFFLICEAQVYRTYTSENPVSVIFLRRNREVHRTYHENGNVKSECEYSKGRLEGTCKAYYEDGILKSRIEFKNGREHGVAVFYHETGVRRTRIDFKRGKPRETLNYDERGRRIDDGG